MIGTVTRWIDDRAFGFVAVEGSRAVFLHLNDFAPPLSKLVPPGPGDVVEFEIIETPKGLRAVEAKIVRRGESTGGRG